MEYEMRKQTSRGAASLGWLAAADQSLLASEPRSFEIANALLVAFLVVLTMAITAGAWMAFSQH